MPGEVRSKAAEMWTHFACICLDGLFLCLWAALNYAVNLAISIFGPKVSTLRSVWSFSRFLALPLWFLSRFSSIEIFV